MTAAIAALSKQAIVMPNAASQVDDILNTLQNASPAELGMWIQKTQKLLPTLQPQDQARVTQALQAAQQRMAAPTPAPQASTMAPQAAPAAAPQAV